MVKQLQIKLPLFACILHSEPADIPLLHRMDTAKFCTHAEVLLTILDGIGSWMIQIFRAALTTHGNLAKGQHISSWLLCGKLHWACELVFSDAYCELLNLGQPR